MDFQTIILKLQFWAGQNCIMAQPMTSKKAQAQ